MYRIEFIHKAAEDYRKLDGSLRKKVDKKLAILAENKYLGEHPGNRFNIDLTGFYKLYVDKKKYRIIYRVIENRVEIIEIWGIGRRKKEEIYRLISKRLNK